MSEEKIDDEVEITDDDCMGKCSDCGRELPLVYLHFLPETEAGFKAYFLALSHGETPPPFELKNDNIKDEPLLCKKCLKKRSEEQLNS